MPPSPVAPTDTQASASQPGVRKVRTLCKSPPLGILQAPQGWGILGETRLPAVPLGRVLRAVVLSSLQIMDLLRRFRSFPQPLKDALLPPFGKT